ncbi:hypothetical protein FH972_024610 [Carpinus fangiana]|uniref:Cutinase n=1 Tax=Carpinus fangiana TaxID=176857 RepID=A0A5N6KYZ0_9ROSI|nr:hypothetical protein FH972_024610 [Carpinus fangiana]
MKFSYSALAVSGLALATAQSNITCQDGVHIIVARASGEPAGFGILGPVKDNILRQIPNSDAIAVPYPAKLGGDITYPESEQEGVGNLTKLVTQYGDACSSSKMVLLGYSQGAQVVGDTLIGIDYEKFPVWIKSAGVDQKYIDNIVAVVMMGDPANVHGEAINHGNSTRDGFFPRNNTAEWANRGLVDKTISYCDANDTFCDKGSSIAVHIGYIGEYGTQAAEFVVSKAGGSGSNSSSPSGTSSATPSATPSTTTSGAPAATTSPGSSGASALLSGQTTYNLVMLVGSAMIFAVAF